MGIIKTAMGLRDENGRVVVLTSNFSEIVNV